jgi:hypothetical protein
MRRFAAKLSGGPGLESQDADSDRRTSGESRPLGSGVSKSKLLKSCGKWIRMSFGVVVYADGPLILNGIIAAGSALVANPDSKAYLFLKEPSKWGFLRNVTTLNVNDSFRGLCPVDMGAWDSFHWGTSGHMYRKVVAWNHMLRFAGHYQHDSFAFLDADTLTHDSLNRAFTMCRDSLLAGYGEYWNTVSGYYARLQPSLKRELDYFFCGKINEWNLPDAPYINAGALLVHVSEGLIDVCRDLLRISIMHPELASHTAQQEQTLLNFACVARGITPLTLNDLGLVRSNERAGEDVLMRHYFANQDDRRPSMMAQLYEETIERALERMGLSIRQCKELGVWY